jgi:hypothetical protein
MSQIFYRKDCIDRFWEERRQAYPNLAYMYDLVVQLVHHVELPEEKKKPMLAELKRLEHIEVGGVKVTIDLLDLVYRRNTTSKLNEPTDVLNEYILPKDILLKVMEIQRALSSIVSECAVLYSPEFPIRDVEEVQETWN